MPRQLNRIGLFLSQVLFSLITPPLLVPRLASSKTIRRIVAFCFGRSYGSRYQAVIDSFGGRYGKAMAEGLAKAREILDDRVSVVFDCGTGTGFVTAQAAGQFPRAVFVAFDLLPGMIRQARENCRGISSRIFHVRSDTFAMPFANGSADLILAQNTLPCFSEFARICRPGGVIVYVDSSAGWISERARKMVEKHGWFKRVTGGRGHMGFWVVAETRDASEPCAGPIPAGEGIR